MSTSSTKASDTVSDYGHDDDLCFLTTVVYDSSTKRFYVDNDFGGNPVYDVNLANDRPFKNSAEELFADEVTTKVEQAIASLNRNKQEGA